MHILVWFTGCFDDAALPDVVGPDGEEFAPPAGAVVRKLNSLSATEVAEVGVPGAPEGCLASFHVRTGVGPCDDASVALTQWGDVGFRRAEGVLAGMEGRCSFACAPDATARWHFFPAQLGWRGTATCTVAGAGAMTIRALDHRPGDMIDPAVGALWLDPLGAGGYGIAPVLAGDTTLEYGISEHGCPGGQPSRPPPT